MKARAGPYVSYDKPRYDPVIIQDAIKSVNSSMFQPALDARGKIVKYSKHRKVGGGDIR